MVIDYWTQEQQRIFFYEVAFTYVSCLNLKILYSELTSIIEAPKVTSTNNSSLTTPSLLIFNVTKTLARWSYM